MPPRCSPRPGIPSTRSASRSTPKLNLKKMMAHKDATVAANVKGVAFLIKKNKIDCFRGTGKVVSAGKVSVTGEDGKVAGDRDEEHRHRHRLRRRRHSRRQGRDRREGDRVVDRRAVLDKVPGHLVVVGGGVIGLELGSVWARLGAKVTVVEFLDTILGGMDGEVAKQFQRMLAKQGFDFKLGSKVTGVAKAKKGATVTFEPVKGGDAETIEADAVLIATGRSPIRTGLGLPRPASRSTSAAGSRPTAISGPTCRASTPSAT